MAMKRRRPTLPAPQRDTASSAARAVDGDDAHVTSADGLTPHASKKLKLLADHAARSPFPDFPHPSAEEVHAVYALLASHTPGGAPAQPVPVYGTLSQPSADVNSAASCGHTSNVLDALIGTILSQNTSAANSAAAKGALDEAFGLPGEPAFEKMARAERQIIVDAIRPGGLANRKAKAIQGVLGAVKRAHPEGRYDLQYLAGFASDDEVMRALVTLDGVGPKTAACVLSFCLGRQAFAVDTHVFRLAGLLGWVPRGADRVGAQAHLERRVPPELKYGLHVMMVRHGRACRGCRKDGRAACPLKSWLKDGTTTQSDSGGVVKQDSQLGDSKALLLNG